MLGKDILLKVSRPGRYIGREWNSIKKDLNEAELKIALCFPDTYEVGMSHLGLRILYGLLNAQKEVACERVFAPWVDMEEALRSHSLELFSLESQVPLREFDVIGFSLQHELNYTNVLNMLNLAGIPLWSSQRSNLHPLIMAGGICCLNPEPMAEFVDFFCIGEAEDMILEVVDTIKKYKIQDSYNGEVKFNSDRTELMYSLARIDGVYVPSLYNAEYYSDGKFKKLLPKYKGVPEIIRKRAVPDLDRAYFPTSPLIPFIQIIHDRISLEIMRGCPQACRFCQARVAYFPKRERSKERVLELAKKSYCHSGYEEISLVSLSTGDHFQIEKIILYLTELFKDKGVSISLPSLKPKHILNRLPPLVAKGKRTGLTFAVEAASQRLRDIINKSVDMEALFRCVRSSYDAGWRRIKLYFMIGLPTETWEDLDSIIDLASELSEIKKGVDGRRAYVTASVSSFIPKAHTPFQWLPMEDMEGLKAKQRYLKSKAKGKVKLLFHDCQMSLIEALLSRGDRRLSNLIFKAWQKGCKFDSWKECFNFPMWQEALKELEIDPQFYLSRIRQLDETLAWEHIDVGIEKEQMKGELEKTIDKYSVLKYI